MHRHPPGRGHVGNILKSTHRIAVRQFAHHAHGNDGRAESVFLDGKAFAMRTLFKMGISGDKRRVEQIQY